VWTQETQQHGGAFAYAPPPNRNRIGMLALVFVAVVVLGGPVATVRTT
jgi:hypothetical protein